MGSMGRIQVTGIMAFAVLFVGFLTTFTIAQETEKRTTVLEDAAESKIPGDKNTDNETVPRSAVTAPSVQADLRLYQDILNSQSVNNIGMAMTGPACSDCMSEPLVEEMACHSCTTSANSCGSSGCKLCQVQNRRKNRSCKSGVAVYGFAVPEVQYGANAGLPSFGRVTHGAWYNGPTFGPSLRDCASKLFRFKRKSSDSVEHCEECLACQCETCGGQAFDSYSEAAHSYDEVAPDFQPLSAKPQGKFSYPLNGGHSVQKRAQHQKAGRSFR